jgi:hypothetical protein
MTANNNAYKNTEWRAAMPTAPQQFWQHHNNSDDTTTMPTTQ